MRYGVALGALVMLMTSTGRAEGIVSATYQVRVERCRHSAAGHVHEYAPAIRSSTISCPSAESEPISASSDAR